MWMSTCSWMYLAYHTVATITATTICNSHLLFLLKSRASAAEIIEFRLSCDSRLRVIVYTSPQAAVRPSVLADKWRVECREHFTTHARQFSGNEYSLKFRLAWIISWGVAFVTSRTESSDRRRTWDAMWITCNARDSKKNTQTISNLQSTTRVDLKEAYFSCDGASVDTRLATTFTPTTLVLTYARPQTVTEPATRMFLLWPVTYISLSAGGAELLANAAGVIGRATLT